MTAHHPRDTSAHDPIVASSGKISRTSGTGLLTGRSWRVNSAASSENRRPRKAGPIPRAVAGEVRAERGRSHRGADRVPGPPRDPLSVGFSWAYRLMSVGLEFSLPALAGAFLDRRWGSTPWATLAGAAIGFGVGMYHLLRMTATNPPGGGPPA